MRLRLEPWGAWARLESMPALIALDRDGVRALGVDGESAWQAKPSVSMPLEVHLAVTSKCAAGCEGCYLDARADGEHVPFDRLETTMREIAAAGVFTVAFGGGEPTTREDIGELGELARSLGLVPVLTTSGLGLSAAKVERLRAFAQVNVSYDGAAAEYERVRGFDGAGQAERSIEALAAAGIPVGVNVVLTRDTFDALGATLLRARSLGAGEAQLLRYKPQGRARSLDYLARRLTREQRLAFPSVLRHASEALRPLEFRIRIDCALVPFLSTDPEIYAHPELLAKFGVLGCEAGGALTAVRVDGKLAPCSFADAAKADGDSLRAEYGRDADLARFRDFSATAPEPCASCAIRTVCKGGCKIVSQYAGSFGADPECPRVELSRADNRPSEALLPA